MTWFALKFCLIVSALVALLAGLKLPASGRLLQILALFSATSFLSGQVCGHVHRDWYRSLKRERIEVTKLNPAEGRLLANGQKVSISYQGSLQLGQQLEFSIDEFDGELVALLPPDLDPANQRLAIFSLVSLGLLCGSLLRLRVVSRRSRRESPLSPPVQGSQ